LRLATAKFPANLAEHARPGLACFRSGAVAVEPSPERLLYPSDRGWVFVWPYADGISAARHGLPCLSAWPSPVAVGDDDGGAPWLFRREREPERGAARVCGPV
jgi:hypothetical protein